MTQKVEVEIDIDISDHLGEASTHELVSELENRDHDFSSNCEKKHLDEHPHSVNLPGDPDIMERFAEVHDKLTWEQWNYLFAVIEKETFEQRKRRPKKYDRL